MSIEVRQPSGPSVWAWVVLLAALLVVYQPALHGLPFADDDLLAFGNDLVTGTHGLWRIWATTEAYDYFPLTYTSFWIDWRLWGANVAAFRLTNIALHAISTLLLWRLLVRLQLRAAALAAALFAFHPVNVASVAWIAERKNTLSLPFYLLAVLLFLRSDDAESGSRSARRSFVGALAAHLAGLLAKTSGVLLPVILLLLTWWRHGRVGRRDLLRTLPFFVVSGLLGLVTVWFQWNRAMQASAVRTDGFASRLAIAAQAVWFYLGKALLPTDLAAFYPRWETGVVTALSFLPLATLVALFLFAWRARSGWGRHVVLALGVHVALLLPVLGFVDVYWMRYSLVADHWQYMAVIAPLALVAETLVALVSRGGSGAQASGRAVTVGAMMLVIVCAGLSRSRAALFRDPEAIWRDVVAKDGGSFVGHAGLGESLARQSRFEEAEVHLREAVRLDPSYATAQHNLGEILLRRSRALAHLARRMAGQGDADAGAPFVSGENEVADEVMDQSRRTGREAELRAAVGGNPGDGPARLALIHLLADDGRSEEALQHCDEAQRLGADVAVLDVARASILMRDEDSRDDAVLALRRALTRRPDLADAHFAIGLIAEAQGDQAVARLAYGHALRLQPRFEEARKRLAAFDSPAVALPPNQADRPPFAPVRD